MIQDVGIEMNRITLALFLIMVICGCRRQEHASASKAQPEKQQSDTAVSTNQSTNQGAQENVQFEPVKVVSATSALLPEYKTTRTNANNEVEAIRR
jgi:PBP1b-binding outer membrane lipoprotein LpoB